MHTYSISTARHSSCRHGFGGMDGGNGFGVDEGHGFGVGGGNFWICHNIEDTEDA